MLRIRQEQLQALENASREQFLRQLVDGARAELPAVAAALPPARLRQRVADAAARAAGHGLTRRIDIRGFVLLDLGIGPDFDSHPAVASVLADPSILPEKKLDYLIGFVTPEQWEEARRLAPAATSDS